MAPPARDIAAADKAAGSDEPERPRKRARVAVACQRCKTRKQKCDGATPVCGNCSAKNPPKECEYIIPSKTMPYGKYQYVKALEARVAELETLLTKEGLTDLGRDHWQKLRQRESENPISPARPEIALPSPQTPSDPAIDVSGFINSIEQAPSGRRPVQPQIAEEIQPRRPHTIVDDLRDLSLEAGGGFVTFIGEESSNITVGKMLGSIVKPREQMSNTPGIHTQSHLSPKSISQGSDYEFVEATSASNELARMPAEIAEKLLKGYLKHISTRWPVLHSPEIRKLHERRSELEEAYDISTLNLVYAIGGRFLETTGEMGNFFPERHYTVASTYLEKILQYHNICSVQTLLLHAVYCLRAPRGPGAWTYIGLATRMCIELGFHRRNSRGKSHSFAIEMGRRVFWSCYCLDRQVSIILGRPFAISDRDIDNCLPLDIDEESSELTPPTPDFNGKGTTSMSCFIHMCKLRKIESSIQQSVYRVDKGGEKMGLPLKVIERFLEQLEDWKDKIPQDTRPDMDTELHSFDGQEYYMIYYYKTLRLLLYPHLTTPTTPGGISPLILQKCVSACGGVCRTYQNLHKKTSVGFSLMALYSVFLAGLNLIYCIWLSPKEVYTITTSNDINACSIVLYVITERWPGAKKYRDAFETIKGCVLQLIEEGRGRVPLTGGNRGLPMDGMKGVLETLRGVQMVHPEGREEFSRMIGDMVGFGGGPHESITGGMHGSGGMEIGESMETAQALAALSGQPLSGGSNPGFPSFGYDGQSSYGATTAGNGIGFELGNSGGFFGDGSREMPLNTMLDGLDMDFFLSNTYTGDTML